MKKPSALKPGKYALKYKHTAETLYRERSLETHHVTDIKFARGYDADYLNSPGAWDWWLSYDAIPLQPESGDTPKVKAKPVETKGKKSKAVES